MDLDMHLTGKQVQQIQDALLDGYPSKDELRMLVRVKLDQNLDAIVGGDNLRVIIFNLVSWAERIDRVDDLIQVASDYNPDNKALQQLAQEWRAALASQAAVQSPPAAPPSAPVGRVSIDLFLSYSRKNLASMRTVRDCLRDAELSVWTDEGLEPGTPAWANAIEDAIGQAQALVVLLSPDAKASAWVGKEVTYAQALGKRVFTAWVAGDTPVGAVPINLIDVQWVDARQDLRRTITQKLRPAILRHLQRPQVALPPIDFDWVVVPAGEFLMGSDKSKDKQAHDNETPQHKLYLPEYRIARVPVMVAQFAKFVEATAYTTTAELRGSTRVRTGSKWEEVKGANWAHPRGPDSDVKQKADHPVTCVSWHDAMAFCEWAGVRLPTEAEWEKAAAPLAY
jgi:formylglycine-generating enzyme required for sulfatase activity